MITKDEFKTLLESIEDVKTTLQKNENRILKREEVERLTGIKTTAIYELIKNQEFPKQVKLTNKSVGWRMSDIQEWINTRPIAS